MELVGNKVFIGFCTMRRRGTLANAIVIEREEYQQDAHFFLIIYFTKIILDMFRTNNSSSSGGLYKQLTVFHHAS
jgi:hypothetical protein